MYDNIFFNIHYQKSILEIDSLWKKSKALQCDELMIEGGKSFTGSLAFKRSIIQLFKAFFAVDQSKINFHKEHLIKHFQARIEEERWEALWWYEALTFEAIINKDRAVAQKHLTKAKAISDLQPLNYLNHKQYIKRLEQMLP